MNKTMSIYEERRQDDI